MRATGIVRRIDDLGRVVIPKEIRRTAGIREGDPLEIFIDKDTGGVCFVPYMAQHEPWRALENLADMIDDTSFGAEFLREVRDLAKRMKKYGENN